MKNTKDLNWLSAPAFLIVLCMILLNAKKPGTNGGGRERQRLDAAIISSGK